MEESNSVSVPLMGLSGDPYEGAQRAYLVLHPDATSMDWEAWVAKARGSANGDFDNFKAFALLCRDASSGEVEPDIARHIAYACGFFEATERVVRSLLNIIPIASCIPHHNQRYRGSQINPDAQFE